MEPPRIGHYRECPPPGGGHNISNNAKLKNFPALAQYIVRQISVKSGVSTALYDKSIKLDTLILEIMGNIFEIGGNRDMLCVSQERVVEVLGVIIQNGRRQRYCLGV